VSIAYNADKARHRLRMSSFTNNLFARNEDDHGNTLAWSRKDKREIKKRAKKKSLAAGRKMPGLDMPDDFYVRTHPYKPTQWLPSSWEWRRVSTNGPVEYRAVHKEHKGFLQRLIDLPGDIVKDAERGVVDVLRDVTGGTFPARKQKKLPPEFVAHIKKKKIGGQVALDHDDRVVAWDRRTSGVVRVHKKRRHVHRDGSESYSSESKSGGSKSGSSSSSGSSGSSSSSSGSSSSSSSSSSSGSGSGGSKKSKQKMMAAAVLSMNIPAEEIAAEGKMLREIGAQLRDKANAQEALQIAAAQPGGAFASHQLNCTLAECDYCGGHKKKGDDGGASPLRAQLVLWVQRGTGAAPKSERDIPTLTYFCKNLHKFHKAVELSALEDMLKGDGPFTVLAPTNEAFEEAEKMGLNVKALMKPRYHALLERIVRYHIIPGKALTLADLKSGDDFVTATENRRVIHLQFDAKTGELAVNRQRGAEVKIVSQCGDVKTANGVVHAISRILVPPDVAADIDRFIAENPVRAMADRGHHYAYEQWKNSEMQAFRSAVAGASIQTTTTTSAAPAVIPIGSSFATTDAPLWALPSGASATSAKVTEEPVLLLSAEEADKIINEYAGAAIVGLDKHKQALAGAIKAGSSVKIAFDHSYISDRAAVQLAGSIAKEHVQQVRVTLDGSLHALPAGGKAYYFDLAIEPTSDEKGPNKEKRGVAERAIKVNFDHSAKKWAPCILMKDVEAKMSGAGIPKEAVAYTRAKVEQLICSALSPPAPAPATTKK
jgi:uncharacterized surface protein with fasciclin (FAS1) repeats